MKNKKRRVLWIVLSILLCCAGAGTVLILAGCATTDGTAEETGVPKITAGPGIWLRGDFHSHSSYSDGDSGLAEVIQSAESAGLDFFAVTDHDRDMSGQMLHWEDPAYRSDKMVLLYGAEWTSGSGHGNIFSDKLFDYGPMWNALLGGDPAEAVRAAHEAEALFSINHPFVVYGPWQYDFRGSDAVEIWNGPFEIPSRNRKSIASFWEPLLLSGRRVTGIGGSDNHHLKGYQRRFNPHGYPTTWVYVSPPRKEAGRVLDGVSAGHVSISYRPDADRLEFYADGDGDGSFESMIGDTIDGGGPAVTFLVRAVPPEGQGEKWHRKQYDITVYKNGEIIAADYLHEKHRRNILFSDVPGGRAFYRVEMHGPVREGLLQSLVMGDTLAVTNPIYAGYTK
jgi:hypothetical protein